MTPRWIIGGVGLVYVLSIGWIGYAAARRTRTARDFFATHRGIGLLALALSTMSASLSGFAFIGGPGLVYGLGLGAVFIVLPACVTNALAAWVLGKRLRLLTEVRGVITLPEAIRVRYDSALAQGLAAVAILVAVVGYLGANVLALGVAIDAIFGVGVGPGIWIGTSVVVAYCVAGGILAGVWTDLLQGAWMMAGSVLVFAVVLEVGGGLGGLSRSILAADPTFLAPWGKLSPLAAVGFYFVFSVGVLGQPHVMHKFFMLRDPLRLKWFPALATAALLMMVLLFFGVGVAVKALEIRGAIPPLEVNDDATPTFVLGFTPTVLAALVFSAVAAAIMSTVNSFVNVAAAAITRDLPQALGRSWSNELRVGRWSTVAVCLFAAGVAAASDTMVAFLGIFGWGLFASTLVPALAVGLNWSGATREGAIASIAIGLGGTIVLEVLAYLGAWSFPVGVSVSAVTLIASLGVFLVVSIATRSRRPMPAPEIQAVMEA